jgi:hypothetical protein
MTPQETKEAFMTEFQEMLRRYNAVFEVYSDNDGFDNSTSVADIDFNAVYDDEGNTIRPYINFKMPNWIKPK